MRHATPFFLLFAGFCLAAAQPEDRKSTFTRLFGLPSFTMQVDQSPAEGPEKTEVAINLGLINDILQFVRLENDRYRASFQVALDIVDAEEAHLGERLHTEVVEVGDFDATNDRSAYNAVRFNFSLAPGKYDVHLDITDLETRKHLVRKVPLEVKSFPADSVQIGSIAFLQGTSDSDSLVRNLAKSYARPGEPIVAEFALSGLAPDDSVELHYVLKHWNGGEAGRWQESIAAPQPTIWIRYSLNSHLREAGNFMLEIECRQGDRRVTERNSLSVKYQPETANGESPTNGAHSAIRALKYISRASDYEPVLKAQPGQRAALLDAFWAKRDPTPGTPDNPLRTEFNRRVDFADRHFSVLAARKQGWETDRGQTYIIYGAPTSIQTQQSDFGAASIEIWYYADTDRRFIFRDKNGDGNYQLAGQE